MRLGWGDDPFNREHVSERFIKYILLFQNIAISLYGSFSPSNCPLMRRPIRLLMIIMLTLLTGPMFSQDTVTLPDRAYGPDQTLCNGKKYTCFLPPGTTGHQYLLSPGFTAGTITIGGKQYPDVSINYDIFNQELLLKFTDESGAVNIIEVSKGWLDGFRLVNRDFRYFAGSKDPGFYQVLGQGPVQVLYYWRKNLNLVAAVGSSNYAFTSAVRDSYVSIGGKRSPFTSKRSLVNLFAPGQRQEIKNYIRRNRIRVNKATDEVIAELVTFIGKIQVK